MTNRESQNNMRSFVISDSAIARWTVLIFVSITMMCGYFLTDMIGPLKTILHSTIGWDDMDFGIFNSGYGWLNVNLFMLIVAGIILDKTGPRFTGVMAVGVMLIGAGLKYYAFSAIDPYILLGGFKIQVLVAALGYAIFAFGYETLNITATRIIIRWFEGKELALALGMNVAFARLGTMLALGMPVKIYNHFHSITLPILFGIVILLLGFLAFIAYVFMDRKLDEQTSVDTGKTDEPFRVRDVVKIIPNTGFWLVALICLLFYASVMTFQKFGVQFLGAKYAIDEEYAGYMMAILPIGALVLTPLFGFLYDRFGRGVSMMIFGSLLLSFVFLLFSFPAFNDWRYGLGLIVMLGIAFSLVPSAMWPTVPQIVPSSLLGTAYAMIFWLQNIGLANAPLLTGWLLSKYGIVGYTSAQEPIYDYTIVLLLFCAFGIIAALLGGCLLHKSRHGEQKSLK